MRLGLHFFEADTPPFCGSKTPEKSEIYQDLIQSENLSIFSPPSSFVTLWLVSLPKVEVHKLFKMELFMK